MIHNIFTIHDIKAKAYLPPFIMHQKDMAVRLFTDTVNQDGHEFNKHPEDYTLFYIGKFDDNTAKITVNQTPESLGLGIEFLYPVTSDVQHELELGE